MTERGYRISNLDVTLILQAPKVQSYFQFHFCCQFYQNATVLFGSKYFVR